MEEILWENDREIALRLTGRLDAVLKRMKIGLRTPGMPPFEHIFIPKNIRFEAYCNFPDQQQWLEIGACSYVHNAWPLPGLQIGRFTSIAGGLFLFGERHPSEWAIQSTLTYNWAYPGTGYLRNDMLPDAHTPDLVPRLGYGPVVVGNDVWIGQNVQLARDIKIGDGAVIGAGAVVTKDVEPYTVVGGVAARPLKLRFPQSIIDRMIECEWWNYHPRHLYECDYHDPARFVREFLARKDDGALEAFNPAVYTWLDIKQAVEQATPDAPLPPEKPLPKRRRRPQVWRRRPRS